MHISHSTDVNSCPHSEFKSVSFCLEVEWVMNNDLCQSWCDWEHWWNIIPTMSDITLTFGSDRGAVADCLKSAVYHQSRIWPSVIVFNCTASPSIHVRLFTQDIKTNLVSVFWLEEVGSIYSCAALNDTDPKSQPLNRSCKWNCSTWTPADDPWCHLNQSVSGDALTQTDPEPTHQRSHTELLLF